MRRRFWRNAASRTEDDVCKGTMKCFKHGYTASLLCREKLKRTITEFHCDNHIGRCHNTRYERYTHFSCRLRQRGCQAGTDSKLSTGFPGGFELTNVRYRTYADKRTLHTIDDCTNSIQRR